MDKTANTDEYIAQLESKCSQLKDENTELQNDKTQLKSEKEFLANKLQMTEEQLKVALLRRFGRSADQKEEKQCAVNELTHIHDKFVKVERLSKTNLHNVFVA
ncbi:MAG: hypothetical protein BKP49_10595 [Treponema sp. CETP13]|nr:MAG: hypothetical protein BKP49_10595 [Treponema sp. CETP13]